MESGAEHYKKRTEAAQKINATVERVRERYGINAEMTGTPETVVIQIMDAGGHIIKEMGFMKTGVLPIEGKNVAVEKVIEAYLRFPDLGFAEALRKIEETGA